MEGSCYLNTAFIGSLNSKRLSTFLEYGVLNYKINVCNKNIYFATSEVSSCKKILKPKYSIICFKPFILISLDKNNLTEKLNL